MNIEEEQQDHDQMPVAKKYEMLNDRDATKLKLELEGGSGEKQREKKDVSVTETNVASATDDKEVEENEEKKEELDTSTAADTVEDTATDQSIKDESAANNESLINKDNQTAAYDPNVAIGKQIIFIIIMGV